MHFMVYLSKQMRSVSQCVSHVLLSQIQPTKLAGSHVGNVECRGLDDEGSCATEARVQHRVRVTLATFLSEIKCAEGVAAE